MRQLNTHGKGTLAAAPILLRALRTGPEEFKRAARQYVCEPESLAAADAEGQECLELLHAVVGRLQSTRENCGACVYVLEHLARRFSEKEAGTLDRVIH